MQEESNSSALSGNSNKSIVSPDKSLNTTPLSESSGNSSTGFLKTLFTSPTKKDIQNPLSTIRDTHCKYCSKPINNRFCDFRCNGDCNSVAHYRCTVQAYKSIQINIRPDRFFCLWCTVYKYEENARQQFQILIDETDTLNKSNDLAENSNKNVITPKKSQKMSPKILINPSSPSKSSGNSNERSFKITATTITSPKTECVFSMPVSPCRPSNCSSLKPVSSESDILNKNSTTLSGNLNKSIVSLDKSLNTTPLSESSGNSSMGLFKTLFTSPTKKSPNVTPKTPISGSFQIDNEIIDKSFKIDTPTTPVTPNSFSIPFSPGLPSVSSPLKSISPSSKTQIVPYEENLHFTFPEHNIEESSSNKSIMNKILLELQQCKQLLQERVSHQTMTTSFEQDKKYYLRSLKNLMYLNHEGLRKIEAQMCTVQTQCTELCNHLSKIVSKNISEEQKVEFVCKM
ncbi:hypothetical protein ALC60_10258 [Trachymyrmex zeteki]|uniref:Uncharacterized protein n=1 Tax=Mycetomoellerius zeteki TaxID=64791 RepID=A0A151WRX4_9HYME|nr:PREDICTED: homeobox protein 5-like [Trachymyrmex zeteki]KYQ50662.1 hypothetical protein ALC60_10258 [Trachymyrmex zeteki]